MPASLARVGLITQQFRWDLQVDLSVASRRLRATLIDAESFCSDLDGGAALNAAIFALLKGDTQLIEVPANPIPAGVTFNRLAPTCQLTYAPLGLVRTCLIVGKETEVRPDGQEKGTLLLW